MMPEKSKPKPTKVQAYAAMKAVRGSLRPRSGETSFSEQWAAFKAEECALETRREELLGSMLRKRRS